MDIKNHSFLVTGGTGFLGCHIIPLLVYKGARVRIFARSANSAKRSAQELYGDWTIYNPKFDINDDENEINEKRSNNYNPPPYKLKDETSNDNHNRIDRNSKEYRSKAWKQFINNVEFIEGSILDEDDLDQAINGVDGIFHLAGQVKHSRDNVKEMYETNVDGSLLIMKIAEKYNVKRIVFASSSGVVGCKNRNSFLTSMKNLLFNDNIQENKLSTDDDNYCLNNVKGFPYYKSKIEAEKRLMGLGLVNGVDVIFMRPSVLLGPGDIKFRSTQIVLSYLQRHIPIVPNGYMSFVDVRDCAKAFVKGMEKGKPFTSYLLASENCTLNHFFASLQDISGIQKPCIRHIPDWVVVAGSQVLQNFYKMQGIDKPDLNPVRAEMSTYNWSVDCSNSIRDLDFNPTDPYQTLSDTVDWINNNQQFFIYSSNNNNNDNNDNNYVIRSKL